MRYGMGWMWSIGVMLLGATVFAQVPDTALIRGVVQVIAYENLYGNEPKMMGWGSASVIDKNGVLLTNNHVVDDGFGGTLDGFVVCLSKNFNERPLCHYTASLLQRDITKDIALLRIDDTDIFGKKVQFSEFTPLPVRSDYIPVPQDNVVAVGYPRIGADTITQTVGVVAGTQLYNHATYIKTDALIAGGNSGGPLMKDGAVIGVNTFGVGVEGGLGYALLIAEATEFIDTHTHDEPIGGFDRAVFHTYLRSIETVNTTLTIEDDLFSMRLPSGYRVVEYVPNKKLASRQMLSDDTRMQYFSFSRRTTPTLTTDQELSDYLQGQRLYDPSYQKVKKISLGGYEAWEFVDKTDPSEGLARGRKQYVIQLNTREILTIDIQAPAYNESLFAEAKNQLEEFLSTISFQSDVLFDDTSSLVLQEPDVTVRLSKERGVPVGREAGSLGDMKYSQGLATMYLGTMRETLSVNVYPQTRDLGKGLSIEELMETQTQYMDTSSKHRIVVDGYDGYVVCSDNDTFLQTTQGTSVVGSSCEVYIVIDTDPMFPYMLTMRMEVESKNFGRMKQVLASYLDRGVMLPSSGEEESTADTALDSFFDEPDHVYSDVAHQKPQFTKMLTTLYDRNLLPKRSEFRGDTPLTWGMVTERRVRYMLNASVENAKMICGDDTSYDCLFSHVYVPTRSGDRALSEVLNGVTIDMNAYAAVDAIETFSTVMELSLAEVALPYNEFVLTVAGSDDIMEHLYTEQKKQLDDRRFAVYGKRKIDLSEVVEYAEFIPTTTYRRHKELGLISDPYFSPEIVSFTQDIGAVRRTQKTMRDAVERACNDVKSFECFYRYAAEDQQYEVITRGVLVPYLASQMDAALFDSSLITKKEEKSR